MHQTCLLLEKCLIFNVDQSCRYVYSGLARVWDGSLGGAHGEVGGRNSETECIGMILDALDEAVSVHVGISSTGSTISGAGFLLLGVAVGVSIAVLS